MKKLIIGPIFILTLYSCVNNSKAEKDLKTKREKILQDFENESEIMSAQYDTLIDLNFDDNPDYVIGYGGINGTGINNRIRVYLYNTAKNNYIEDEYLSGLPNPSYYLDHRKITAFYIAQGGGGGRELEWINNKWIETKTFQVEANGNDETVWELEFPIKKQKDSIKAPFCIFPPKEVLEIEEKYRE